MEIPENEVLLTTPNTSPLLQRLNIDYLSVNGIFTPQKTPSCASTRSTSLSSTPNNLSRRSSACREFERHYINPEIFVTLVRSAGCGAVMDHHEQECEEDGVKHDPDEQHDPKVTRIDGDGRCYPNCDASVWLRSCEKEIITPITGEVKGEIPNWINGSLIRNGPGNFKVGDMQFQHLFDSSALLHRFGINDGHVTYQCRFIETDTLKRNLAANRIVVSEFGTCAVPDPCQSIFQRVTSMFRSEEVSDNTMISIYPFGDEYYSFTEGPTIHRINPETLETEGKKLISDYVGIASQSSHPHVMPDGTVYNLGMSGSKLGPAYNIICFPHGEGMFEDAYIVGSISCRWKLHPGYMHTFGITENYFVIVEQPLSISLSEWIKAQIMGRQMSACLKWFEGKCTYIYLMERSSGKVKHTYRAEAFFYLHIINQYEQNGHVIVDICCYKDAGMINCMYVESMLNMQNNPNYAAMFRGRPLRFVLPLPPEPVNEEKPRLVKSLTLSNILSRLNPRGVLKRSESEHQDMRYVTMPDTGEKQKISDIEEILCNNLVKLANTKAQAYKMPDDSIFLRPELLCDLGCETPRINYHKKLGQLYRYFYAISSDVDAMYPGTLIKVDVVTKTRKIWYEANCYPSEPVFVSRPDATSEDDGVVLASMVWGNQDENHVGLLFLCAKTWVELGRCEFRTPSPVPKCLHGWFAPRKDSNHNNES